MESQNDLTAGPSTILIVNDEQSLRSFFHFNLQVRGYEVIDMSGSQEVLQRG